MESSTTQLPGALVLKQLPHKSSTEGLDSAAGSNRSTALVTEENSAYNQLPAHMNSTDNDYDVLPALKNNTSN